MSPDFKYALSFTAPQVQAIAVALEGAPYRVAAPILSEMQRQVREIEAAQNQASGEEPAKLKAVGDEG